MLVVNKEYPLNDFFEVVSQNYLEAELNNIDFTNPEQATTEINNWVNDKTNHHIEHLIDPSFIDGNSAVVLVSAFYFKGNWKYPFFKWMTQNKPFNINSEDFIEIPMMHITARYKYAESQKLDAKILEMLYIGEKASMVIVLPNAVDGIESLLKKLEDLTILDLEMMNMELEDVKATIPKITLESTINVKEVLQQMNVNKIFNDDAEITGLLESRQPTHVSKAIQKAFITVDEIGNHAAAGNAAGVSFLSPRAPNEVKYFVADHPFVLFIKKDDITILSALYRGSS
ncbi:antichymotrypsin-2-like [Epargyreus clarus]|uniref:antichymotrypsin-2-like n=1 Tax=Epargyreus clarus TaxID=520877 RepID=UPI003C2C9962